VSVEGRGDGPKTVPLIEPIDIYYCPSSKLGLHNKFKSPVSQLALYFFEFYLNGFIAQWNRLAEGYELSRGLITADLKLDREAAADYYRSQDRNRLDLHFYLICWDKLDKWLPYDLLVGLDCLTALGYGQDRRLG
jgi:hypothetical protein